MNMSLKLNDYRQYLYTQYPDVEQAELNEILLNVFGITYSALFSDIDVSISSDRSVRHAIRKYLGGMPVNKIFNTSYFYQLRLYVDRHVLAPRADTETLVERAISLVTSPDITVLDLCTGSGAVGIAVQLNTRCIVHASDVSRKALRVARRNARTHDAHVTFIRSNMFDGISAKYDIIISNPPYISLSEMSTLSDSVLHHDPLIALYGGTDGLDFYRLIAKNATHYLSSGGRLLLEIGETQAEAVRDLLLGAGYEDISIVDDLRHSPRVIIARKERIICTKS